MAFQIGQTYKMKTYIHDFLDDVKVVAIYVENNSRVVVLARNNGQIYHMTERDIASVEYYLLEDDDATVAMTDLEDDYEDDPNEIFIDFNPQYPLM